MTWQPNEASTHLSLKRVFEHHDEIYTEKPKKKIISLSKSRSHTPSPTLKDEYDTHQSIIPSRVKQEPLDFSLDVKQEPSFDVKQDTVKPETPVSKQEPLEPSLPEQKDMDTSYHCPLCNQDLTDQRSSYLRQRHVDQCIASTETSEESPVVEFDDCPFCAKDLKRLTAERRQLHLNDCLDEIDSKQEAVFAGQPVPFLESLDICPVCHEDGPFKDRLLKQKIKHIKQCAKQNQFSLQSLVQKLKWIGWGHKPTLALSSPSQPSSSSPHQTVFRITDTVEEDNDFSDKMIVSRANLSLSTKPARQRRQEDQQDEELQVALAISKSIQAKKSTRTIDLNAANVWSIKESRQHAIKKLDTILFPSEQDQYAQTQRERSLWQLRPSRLNSCHDKRFWRLANLSQSDVNYTSEFLMHNRGV